MRSDFSLNFQHDAHFKPIVVGVGKRGAHYLAHGAAKAAPVAGSTLRITSSVPADSRQ